jgi:membrane protease YdiL (CAAX protease family)
LPNRFAREKNKTKVRTNKYAAFIAIGIPFSIFLVLGIPITLEILPTSPSIFFIHPLLIVSSFAAMFVNDWSFQDVGLRLDGLTRNLLYSGALFVVYAGSQLVPFIPIRTATFDVTAILWLLRYVFLVGLGEELYYRGLTVKALSTLKNQYFAIIVAAGIFGLGHFADGIGGIVGAFVSAFPYLFIRNLTNNIVGLSIVHGLLDCLPVLLVPSIPANPFLQGLFIAAFLMFFAFLALSFLRGNEQ